MAARSNVGRRFLAHVDGGLVAWRARGSAGGEIALNSDLLDWTDVSSVRPRMRTALTD